MRALAASLVFGSIFVGCGGGGPDDYPDMGTVSGTVTMGGQPLADARVTFTPKGSSGRPSTGITDSGGYYELSYSLSVEGAKVGEHAVSISTYTGPAPDVNGDFQPGKPETVPMQYNTTSELVETVDSGSNTFDFELESNGEIDDHKADNAMMMGEDEQ